MYPNKYWADFKLTDEGKKAVKLPNGGDTIEWRPSGLDDKTYSVVMTTVAANHLKAQEVTNIQDEMVPGVATGKERIVRGGGESDWRSGCVAADCAQPRKQAQRQAPCGLFARGRRLEIALNPLAHENAVQVGLNSLTPPPFLVIVKRFRKNAPLRVS